MRSRPRNFRTRSSQAAISSGVVSFCRESIGWRWRTAANSAAGAAPTRRWGAHSLPNEFRVLLHEAHSAPVISSYVFYRSGSRNEPRGQTGIAHLFEHMMFNGGKKFGPGKFDDLIEGNGGSTNGYTTRDY